MFNRVEWHIAGRYLRTRRKEGYISFIAIISFLGIMLGVATLIVVMAVMNGFRADLLDRILGMTGHAIIQSPDRVFEQPQDIASQLETLERVEFASPLIDGQAMFSVPHTNNVQGVLIRAMPIEYLQKLPALKGNIKTGAMADLGTRKIAIGERLASKYGLELGDNVSLITPRGITTPFGTAPRVKSYKVGAVFHVGLSEYDANVILMSFDAAAALLGRTEKDSVLEIIITDPDAIGEARAEITEKIGADYVIRDWRQNNATLSGALEIERNVMFLILSLILLIAALNIVSGLVMLVRDKARDIAVMRTMGASRAMVLRIFFLTGASIGVLGTLSGIGLGVVICENIEIIRQALMVLTGAEIFPANVYFLEQIPARIEWQEMVNIIVMALGLSFLSTLYPAWRAARLEPVEALRYE